ncbi:MAG: hypothetical protein A2Y03_07695 [Omnitrophica WOR_2 bacterium GWF2_38_59]|nr:MAG: hypothetical protein A2Y03_07695 [Omnitrophica WOR_2 bacterium GWF2_38_59]OGX49451.1 MAG: hypothetical protein A2243_09570 [Omnitrophica WOR_2 bacterium RIFOXYA2_FULL_38_17]OGX54780.1 MAG: hypothetical protein A2267_06635 [Omnitrophica WOR_2 bacterium RIFOXYA12_FULL_38_10]OGX57809.1 MAG: hypothetical protein A2447_06930 [Omnitrophica WOR_2 bacterium RIFOXYC2_FULL_38_12]OGX58555.1 MAG: hypothetical protein A2306_10535 [Omnitrophica WOR_2 bacterium RIFOXYB2_FULL_38_16]HBG62465.1 hypothet
MKKQFKIYGFFVSSLVLSIICFVAGNVFAQNIDNLEARVSSIESYLETIQPSLADFSDNMQKSIAEYTKGLEVSLERYSKNLQYDLEKRFEGMDRKKVILDPYSQSFQRVDTNTGVFLISVSKLTKLERGVRLHLNIGNPNFADYKDFKVKLFWGPAWNESGRQSFEEWRGKLTGTEFSFKGVLQKGMWNPVEVDLGAMSERDIEYIECEMEVLSVEMSIK